MEIDTENAQTLDLTKARLAGDYTRNPMIVLFAPSERGKQATYFARWGGRRNEFGNWSLPIAMTVAA